MEFVQTSVILRFRFLFIQYRRHRSRKRSVVNFLAIACGLFRFRWNVLHRVRLIIWQCIPTANSKEKKNFRLNIIIDRDWVLLLLFSKLAKTNKQTNKINIISLLFFQGVHLFRTPSGFAKSYNYYLLVVALLVCHSFFMFWLGHWLDENRACHKQPQWWQTFFFYLKKKIRKNYSKKRILFYFSVKSRSAKNVLFIWVIFSFFVTIISICASSWHRI
jgi:hypothetical protein